MKRIAFNKHESDNYIQERGIAPCFICQIVAGDKIRDRHQILFEDERVIAFLSSKPTQYGQVLVCPKQHAEQISKDLDDEEYLHLQSIIFKFSKAIQKALNPERIYVASFGSQQMNRHIHFHLVPIPKGTPIREQQMASMMPELVGYLDLEDSEWKELAKNIIKSL
ncbi:MAG: HIT family protein [Patescibacteria group bacterium]|jgi:histidine triad (HIT) family protein